MSRGTQNGKHAAPPAPLWHAALRIFCAAGAVRRLGDERGTDVQLPDRCYHGTPPHPPSGLCL
jgi:hypothetical protein